MTKNPFVNALAAFLYIVVIVSVMFYGNQYARHVNNFIAPIAAVSLFTLSAAVMGYIFGYHPAQLFLMERRKKL